MIMHVGQDVGNYHILAEISHGASAIIYRATHRILTGRVVAIKLLYTAQLPVQGDQEGFFREARMLAALQHPHILPLIDANIYEGLPYIITEFAARGSLRNRINRRQGSAWPAHAALEVLKQVGEALHFAHQHHIVHSDVKPENILFQTDSQAVMADFDIARVLSKTNAAARSLGGTAAYMSPEQFQGRVRKESDQYALGCIAYELLTGKRPFRGEDQATLMQAHLYEQAPAPTQVYARLPTPLNEVLLKALAKKYTDRYEDIPSFLHALSLALETGRQRRQSPLILKETTTAGEDNSTIYYEKTELNAPEDEAPAPPPARKRRTTKAIDGDATPAPRKARTTPVKTRAAHPIAKQQADSTEEKKPVRKAAGRTKRTVSEAIETDKKTIRKPRSASPTRKTSVDEKPTKATARTASVAKKPANTKPPVAKRRTRKVEVADT